jgi:hypothetical protein
VLRAQMEPAMAGGSHGASCNVFMLRLSFITLIGDTMVNRAPQEGKTSVFYRGITGCSGLKPNPQWPGDLTEPAATSSCFDSRSLH